MQVYKTYKFRMYPNREQQITINKFVGTSRFIYNNLSICKRDSEELRSYEESVSFSVHVSPFNS